MQSAEYFGANSGSNTKENKSNVVFKCNNIEMLNCEENDMDEVFEQSLEIIEKKFADKLLSCNVSFGDDSATLPGKETMITEIELQNLKCSSTTMLNKLLDLTVDSICPERGLISLTLWSLPADIELDVAMFKMAQKTSNLKTLRVGDVLIANEQFHKAIISMIIQILYNGPPLVELKL